MAGVFWLRIFDDDFSSPFFLCVYLLLKIPSSYLALLKWQLQQLNGRWFVDLCAHWGDLIFWTLCWKFGGKTATELCSAKQTGNGLGERKRLESQWALTLDQLMCANERAKGKGEKIKCIKRIFGHFWCVNFCLCVRVIHTKIVCHIKSIGIDFECLFFSPFFYRLLRFENKQTKEKKEWIDF